jgi:hypothetical protein
VGRERIAEILATPAPVGLLEDLEIVGSGLEDPFERWERPGS